MANRVEMTSPASAGTVLVPAPLVGRFQAQGWTRVESPVEKPIEPVKRKPGRPKKSE